MIALPMTTAGTRGRRRCSDRHRYACFPLEANVTGPPVNRWFVLGPLRNATIERGRNTSAFTRDLRYLRRVSHSRPMRGRYRRIRGPSVLRVIVLARIRRVLLYGRKSPPAFQSVNPPILGSLVCRRFGTEESRLADLAWSRGSGFGMTTLR